MTIAVLTMRATDGETLKVMDWLDHFGVPCLRLNGEDLPESAFAIDPEQPEASFLVSGHGKKVPLSDIRSVWFRRSAEMQLPDLDAIAEPELRRVVERHLRQELKGAGSGLGHALSHARWLSHPETAAPSKFNQLRLAKTLGIDIPDTLVTNQKTALLDFYDEHGEIIVKCITDPDVFPQDERVVFSTFTNIFEKAHIDSLPERFFPVLVQKKIEKAWEIRSFYLDGACYSMAIFSQSNERTQLDFRHYDHQNPNRNLPFRLGEELENRISELMDALSLNTGSLDLIRGVDGRTYFLEVNPLGMFSMVSYPCNMNLEKKVAEFLVAGDRL